MTQMRLVGGVVDVLTSQRQEVVSGSVVEKEKKGVQHQRRAWVFSTRARGS